MSEKKKTNVPIFIPHYGCKNSCSFCNQNIITGEKGFTDSERAKKIIEDNILPLKRQNKEAEIAFFGGSFTGIGTGKMTELLMIAKKYINEYSDIFTGIRISTRPDLINDEILRLLKRFPVKAIELGAQSMSDDVLIFNRRGHTADDVRCASKLIKEYKFSLGLQMMTGLYMDTLELSYKTAVELLKLKPDTVRIYPTVIMKNTFLAELYEKGEYKSFTFEETVELSAKIYELFIKNNVNVIRIGLDTSREVEENCVGGNYHPSMGEIVISRYYYNYMKETMQKLGGNRFIIETDKKYISKLNGNCGINKKKLEEDKFTYKIKEKSGVTPRIIRKEQ